MWLLIQLKLAWEEPLEIRELLPSGITYFFLSFKRLHTREINNKMCAVNFLHPNCPSGMIFVLAHGVNKVSEIQTKVSAFQTFHKHV